MRKGISKQARTELIEALRLRYQQAKKDEKTRILDQFVAVAGCHRKHAVRLLGDVDGEVPRRSRAGGRRIYDEAVREALIITVGGRGPDLRQAIESVSAESDRSHGAPRSPGT